MSMDPGLIRLMLAQGLTQGPQSATFGGDGAGPQMQSQVSPLGASANLMQKLMLMRALQQRPGQQPPPPQPQPVGPGGFPLPMGTPVPQTMNAQPVPTYGAQNA